MPANGQQVVSSRSYGALRTDQGLQLLPVLAISGLICRTTSAARLPVASAAEFVGGSILILVSACEYPSLTDLTQTGVPMSVRA